MENFLLYFAKVNGLIILFYLLYLVLLRKETFYVSNRWYLLVGLVTAIILPLITFTKTIWVNPEPISKFIEVIPITDDKTSSPVSEAPIDWSLIFSAAYGLIAIVILLKVGFEIASFFFKIVKLNKEKEANYTLIYANSTENPFSFFNYIVINPTLFSKEEFEHILTHERIHAKQFHSIDVLFSKVFCALLWINPISWLYRKAMLQNLEFIADNQSLEEIDSKYEYQKTLLKVVVHQQIAGITNPFYQSLIKKRIIMLHKNQSDRRNAWKYSLVLPLLGVFVFFFQVKVVAQEKQSTTKEIADKEIPFFIVIDKNNTEKQIKESSFAAKENYDVDLKFSKIKRNSKGEIISIKVAFTNKGGSSGATEISGSKPIQSFCFFINGDEMGFKELKKSKNNENVIVSKYPITDLTVKTSNALKSLKITDKDIYIDGVKTTSNEISELDPNAIEKVEVNNFENNVKITTKTINISTSKINPDPIIYLNDKEISKDEMDKIDVKTIKSVDVKKGKSNGEIRIVSKKNNSIEDAEIVLDNKVISKEDLNKLDKNEIESVNIKNNNGKRSIEIQKKSAKTIGDNSLKEVRYVERTDEVKEELTKAKMELEKAKAEIEKAKAEIEKLKSNNKK
jgi:beta-lactamase regulating signal transducer with metallopeptidase domain